MKIPLEYNARSLLQRPVSTLLTALGIALVVAVFIGMLALANGFRAALIKTGSTQNVMVLRRGADSELSSGIDRQSREHPGVLALTSRPGPDGRPMFSPEVYVIIPLPRAAAARHHRPGQRGGARHQPRRLDGAEQRADRGGPEAGVGQGRDLRGQEDGGPVQPHRHRRDAALRRPRTGPWSAGSAPTARRSSRRSGARTSSSCRCSGATPSSRSPSGSRIRPRSTRPSGPWRPTGGSRWTCTGSRTSTPSSPQLLGRILTILALMITSIMAVGAIFGAINTMYAAVASRSHEIAVLLTLGFHPRSVLASFLAESALIAVVGGIIGALLALPINGLVTSTTNWASFSEIAFSLSGDTGTAAGRTDLRGSDGRDRRLLPGAAGGETAGCSSVAVGRTGGRAEREVERFLAALGMTRASGSQQAYLAHFFGFVPLRR